MRASVQDGVVAGRMRLLRKEFRGNGLRAVQKACSGDSMASECTAVQFQGFITNILIVYNL